MMPTQSLPEVDAAFVKAITLDLINAFSPTGSEERAGRYVEGVLKKLGLRTWTQEVEAGRLNVVGVLPGSGGGPVLMLMGHLDTVWAGDEEGIRDLGPGYQPHAEVVDDWIGGMGAYNMKSGLASAIAGVKAVIDARLKLAGDLVVAAVVGETARCQVDRFQGARYRAAGIGAWHLVHHGVTADMAIVPEPTYSRISIVSGGYVYFRITVYGNPGATYRRGGSTIQVAESVDALQEIIDVKEAIEAWAPEYVERHRFRGELATNVSIIALDAGLPFRPTKIAPIGRLYVEVDTMPGQRSQDVVEEFRAVVGAASRRSKAKRIELDVLQTIPPAEVSEKEYVVRALAQAHLRVHKREPEITFDAWMADTTALTRAGIPAVCYGPAGRMRAGGSGYYAPEGEQCYLPDLVTGAQTYAIAAVDICSQDRTSVLSTAPTERGTVV
jgi:acetylornithine deacetylase/succinyl-diaminopimelate desuccinylase-like protein